MFSCPVCGTSCEADELPPLLSVMRDELFPKLLPPYHSPKQSALSASCPHGQSGTLLNGFQDPFYFTDFLQSLQETPVYLS